MKRIALSICITILLTSCQSINQNYASTQTESVDVLEYLSQPKFIPLSQMYPEEGVVVFSMKETGYWIICVASEMRIMEMCINYGDGYNYLRPTISPNGRYITAVKEKEGEHSIVLINTENGKIVYTTPRGAIYPVWSPDEKYLSFSYGEDGKRNINIVEIENIDKPVTKITDDNYDNIIQSWNKQEIMFLAKDDNIYKLYKLLIDKEENIMGQRIKILDVGENVRGIKWNHKEDTMAVVLRNTIGLLKEGGNTINIIAKEEGDIWDIIDWSIDDSYIAYTITNKEKITNVCIINLLEGNSKYCLDMESKILFRLMPVWGINGEVIYIVREKDKGTFIEKNNIINNELMQISGQYGIKDWLSYYKLIR